MNSVQSVHNRLLILTKYFCYGFGGTPEATLLLARGLTRAGFSVDVRANDRIVLDAGELCDLPPMQITRASRPNVNVGQYVGVIVAGAWNPDAVMAAISARKLRIPILYQTKGQLCRIEFTRLRDLRRLLYLAIIEMWVALFATRIQFTSKLEMAASLLPNFIKSRKCCVIPEPFDPERLGIVPRNLPMQDGPLRLGFIAQISPRKGLLELVKGLISWSRAHPDRPIELTVAGTAVGASQSYLGEIEALANRYRGKAKIRFVGQVSGEERAQFYANLDVVVVPSHFESFCLAIPEALWFGCAVLAAPRLGALEALKGHPAIRVMDEVSPEAIARALDELCNTLPSLRVKRVYFQPLSALDSDVSIGSVLRALNLRVDMDMNEPLAALG